MGNDNSRISHSCINTISILVFQVRWGTTAGNAICKENIRIKNRSKLRLCSDTHACIPQLAFRFFGFSFYDNEGIFCICFRIVMYYWIKSTITSRYLVIGYQSHQVFILSALSVNHPCTNHSLKFLEPHQKLVIAPKICTKCCTKNRRAGHLQGLDTIVHMRSIESVCSYICSKILGMTRACGGPLIQINIRNSPTFRSTATMIAT